MDQIRNIISENHVIENLIFSLIIIIFALIFRYLALQWVRRISFNNSSQSSPEVLRTWIVQIRNFSLSFVGASIVFIWSGEIKAAAFPLAAVAVAIVVGMKELIMCFLGGIVKASSRAFKIGDRIQVQNYRGDVIDMNFITTTIYEIGPDHILHQYTGRKVIIPNSLFLINPVYNESFTAKYFFHTFKIPLHNIDNWSLAKEIILKKAQEECAAFLDEARTYMNRIGKIEGLDTPNVNPRVSLHIATPDEVHLLVRIPSPPHKQGPMEQSIIEHFLTEFKRLNHNPTA
jgi:small-conductance mechanosensitive channel